MASSVRMSSSPALAAATMTGVAGAGVVGGSVVGGVAVGGGGGEVVVFAMAGRLVCWSTSAGLRKGMGGRKRERE